METLFDLNHVDVASAGAIIGTLVFSVRYLYAQHVKSQEKVLDEKNKTIERLIAEKEYLQKKEEEVDKKLNDFMNNQLVILQDKVDKIYNSTNGTKKPISRMIEEIYEDGRREVRKVPVEKT